MKFKKIIKTGKSDIKHAVIGVKKIARKPATKKAFKKAGNLFLVGIRNGYNNTYRR